MISRNSNIVLGFWVLSNKSEISRRVALRTIMISQKLRQSMQSMSSRMEAEISAQGEVDIQD